MDNKISVIYNNGKKVTVAKNSRIIDIEKELPNDIKTRIVGAKINNTVVSLDTKLKQDCCINFIVNWCCTNSYRYNNSYHICIIEVFHCYSNYG